MRFAPGTRLGGYEILGELGTGGMGQVYRARDVQLGRLVAIKVLGDEARLHPEGVRRLLGEAKAASALNHPNIVIVHGIGDQDGMPYVVTELVDGETLRSRLAQGPLAPSEAVDIALQVLAGLGKAHALGLVHRDLKPENLMITGDGIVKILDFGLAKLVVGAAENQSLDTLGVAPTATGLIMGTASYMSPEQARGSAADARSDLFSLGIILYEMLTGINPFRQATIADTVSSLLRDEAPLLREQLPALPVDLADLVDRLLDKDPAQRPSTAREVESMLVGMRARLQGMSASQPVHHPGLDRVIPGRGSTGTPVPRTETPRKAWMPVAAIALPIVLIAVFAMSRPGNKTSSDSMFKRGSQVVAVMSIDDRTQDPDLAQADVGRVLADAFVQILYDCQGVQVVSPVRIQSLLMNQKRRFVETGHDVDLARNVCRRSGANTILAGALSRLGQTYVLNATLTELTTGKLLGSFETRAQGKDQLLEMLSSGIAPAVTRTLGRASGVALADGRSVSEIMTPNFEAYRHFALGADLNNSGRFKEAVPELQKALELDPGMGIVWTELSCSFSFLGDEAAALEAHRKAVAQRNRMSRKEQMWTDANGQWVEGNGERYVATMEQYLKEFPDDRQARFYIGLGQRFLSKDCGKAISTYEQAYALTPEYWPITKNLAECKREMGDSSGALHALDRFIGVVKTGPDADEARRYRNDFAAKR